MKIKTNETETDWKKISDNWIIQFSRISFVSLTLLSLIAIAVTWTMLPAQLPLWYSKPWGTEQLASQQYILVLPVFSILVFLVNYALGRYVSSQYLVFTQALYLCSTLVCALSTFAVLKIILLVL